MLIQSSKIQLSSGRAFLSDYIQTIRGISLFLKKSKTDPAAGIAMGALAVLPSNKCDAHETFHDWSIPCT
jgi:hypothetical protein